MLMRYARSHRPAESDICMVGAFPPPVHGMAMLNAAMHDLLLGTPMVLDLAPASLRRTWFNRLARIGKVAKAFKQYCREILGGRGSTLYIGLSGGWGQLYEALFVAIARAGGARIFLHHHSFAYLERRKVPTRLLVRLAGPAATHIVLCERMEQKLRQCYPTASVTRVVSNAAVLGSTGGLKYRTRRCVEKIGFLGNISREKGIMEFLAVAERLQGRGTGFEMYIAGPFENDSVENAVQEAAVRLQTLHYLGPRYGPEKESFWDLIDVLLFPSKYSNETAPLVVHEAMGHGIPVVAWERGCLSNMVRSRSGLLVDRDRDFVAVAEECLLRWQSDPAVFAEMSNAAAEDFSRQHAKSRNSLEALLNELCPKRTLCSDLAIEGMNSQ
jgi:glycosyltransferase involved in cell wall biosynthesis